MKFIKNFFFFLGSKYETKWVENLPKNLDKNTIYIVGGRNYPFQSVFLCPDNCGRIISLNISKQHNFLERWRIKEHKNGTLSIHPSIYMNRATCGSHFWFRHGKIFWV